MVTFADLRLVAGKGAVIQFNDEPGRYWALHASRCDGECPLPADEPCAGVLTVESTDGDMDERHVGARARCVAVST